MQNDDLGNQGLLWVERGETQWNAVAGTAGKACASCHVPDSGHVVTVRAGTNTVLGLAPHRIDDIVRALERPKTVAEPPPLWDGRASERVATVLQEVGRSAPLAIA